MEFSSPSRTFDFPLEINQAEIEYLGVHESFTWGPQTVWLLCGLTWIFYFLVRDIPELARNTLLFGSGATLLATLGAGYELRRRNRQTFLYPLGGQIGLYRGNMYKYSFSPAEMLRVRLDSFGWILVVCKLLLPMLLLIVILGVVMFDGLKQSGPHPWQDMALFIYAMLFALLALSPSTVRTSDLPLSGYPPAEARPTGSCTCIPENCTRSRLVTAARYDRFLHAWRLI